MSVNFNTYSGIKSERMHRDALVVGQTLVRIIRPNSGWDVSSPIRTAEYTVKKILKTRLVLESVEPQGRLQVNHELRLIIESSSWSMRAGEISDAAEGTSNAYSRTMYEFATVGDPAIQALIGIRETIIAEAAERNALKTAIAEVRHELDGNADLAKIDAAIEALTKLRNKMAAE